MKPDSLQKMKNIFLGKRMDKDETAFIFHFISSKKEE